MKYLLYADMLGISVEMFRGTHCRVKEIPIEVLQKRLGGIRNITHSHLSTQNMNKHLGTAFEVIDFTDCFDNGDVIFVIRPKELTSGQRDRYYTIEVLGDPDQIVRRPLVRNIDELIESCNKNNAEKSARDKDRTQSDKNREWAVRDYFNRVDKAYRLYDSAISKIKPESINDLAYHKRTLSRDLDLAFKRACEAKLTVEEIRSAELSVLKERMRRTLHAI